MTYQFDKLKEGVRSSSSTINRIERISSILGLIKFYGKITEQLKITNKLGINVKTVFTDTVRPGVDDRIINM